ncbi:class I SAM-dependent methyltransferase [Streptomyces sp. ASQP_92]|uniref:class I SAM-dependent methyltransferase n=1 Tax=Streptomyces sp. ASQP_92 TaxID=2979116 RepID=UPI0021C12A1B|nr:class I SAM-dependent methyltransferase [Streptomyces sp. ASQP_92]MCT9089772.1 class I SAM-dependent methyltransferase [Streptomyces sp. ASQP_92]
MNVGASTASDRSVGGEEPSSDYAALRRDPEYAELNRALLDLVPAGSERAVLDLGCGDGAVSEQLLSRDPAMTLIGVDPDPALLKAARARLGDRARFAEGEASSVSRLFPPGTFDVVVLANCVHLVPDLAAALGAIGQVLKGDGRLVFNSAFYSGAETAADLPRYAELVGTARSTARRRGLPLTRAAAGRPSGLRRTAGEYRAALAAAGFKAVTTEREFVLGSRFLAALCSTPMFATAALPGVERHTAAELLTETLRELHERAPFTITRRCVYFSATQA